ncbi:glycosyltransferase N-terminal domain-containing protein [Zunongwangia sp. F363]|uniref:3-deoxy-D-manno-octulosonic acid transferase n=1 Tax=Autumnicola tepida TaxID=3075595 RepID=A0ABU3C550_9FLAO|nr:glycosyltransferase N-terminal domain-containing protein [Zunongwangia sp. F363]MDT0641468.1 glycosyltransferase N-terminal domain-containing protein [Zunongwangia sp. F363]
MQFLYNLFTGAAEMLLPVPALFNKKLKQGIQGRKKVSSKLKAEIRQKDRVVWFHAASLGEFEQAVPVMEMIKKELPNHKILVTFFSPSGYENKKKHPLADVITYLPFDTKKNVRKFLRLSHPEMVFFVKYEIWPNYLKELKARNIRSFLLSGAFRENQIYFKSYGTWMRNALTAFEHFFLQNRKSRELLKSIGFSNTSLSGDTRFDRVSRQVEYDNKLDFIENFLQGNLCLVAGSTWTEDEDYLLSYINESPKNVKIIIAPHEIKAEKINALQDKLKKKTARYSEQFEDLEQFQVLIVDTIGLLGKIYSYADVAYVGGAAGTTGLHNILEPATFGVPIVIGSNFSKFPEAIQLQQLAGLYSVASAEETSSLLNRLMTDENFRKKTGMIAGHFINSNTGATEVVRKYFF